VSSRAGKTGLGLLRVGLTQAQKVIIRGVITGSYYIRKGWISFMLHAIALWLWTRPYIERFDRLLARKLHENNQTSNLLAFGNEMMKTVKSWFQYLRALKDKYTSS
jgi:hypothetical protein